MLTLFYAFATQRATGDYYSMTPAAMNFRAGAGASAGNAFAAFGFIPPEYGHRTVVEHRAQLISVAPPPENTEEDRAECTRLAANEIDTAIGGGPAFAAIDTALLLPFEPTDHGFAPILPPGPPPGAIRRLLSFTTPHPPPQNIIASHWSDPRIAVVAARGNAIEVFDPRSSRPQWEKRADGRVVKIRALAWRPYARDTIVAACQAGVAIWNGRVLNVLTYQGHTDLVALSWSCDGAKLCTASNNDGSVRIWDTATGESRVVCKGTTLSYAPNSPDVMLVGFANSNAFRLWKLDSKQCERWGFLAGSPTALAWCPKQPLAVVSARNESALHFMRVLPHGDSELIHSEPTVLPKIGPGGSAANIAWDETGERLAVCFMHEQSTAPPISQWEHDEQRRFAVALYATTINPAFTICPVGFISGPRNSGPPIDLCFRSRCHQFGAAAAVLAVAWASGHVTFTQLFFKPTN